MNNHSFYLSRRRLLTGLAGASALGLGAAPLMKTLAAADSNSVSDYKALVCVFLAGGNDAYNTVLATDAPSWSGYNSARNVAPLPIALAAPGTARVAGAPLGSPAALGGVLPITPRTAQAGRTFALHPVLNATRDLFQAGRLSVVANVGTLVRPLTRDEYLGGRAAVPPKLFSHNDQQSVWQSLSAEGAQVGWGGAMADLFVESNAGGRVFSAVSAAGSAVWLAGRNSNAYQVSPSGPVRVGPHDSWLYGSQYGWDNLYKSLRTARTDPLEQDQVALMTRTMAASEQLRAVLPAVGGSGVLPAAPYISPLGDGTSTTANPLAQQLEVVARMIAARSALGVRRQVFFVTLGGFDTHAGQNQAHADLMARLDGALAYFNAALTNLPGGDASNLVTTFTASDFGRCLQSNGTGTDHGWGAHHFVMGPALQGGNIFGRFPTVGLLSPEDAGNGRLIPSTSVDQYAATLASWFGVADSQLDSIFPNLRNFGSARSLNAGQG